MSVGEEHATAREAVEVRRPCLRMSAQNADPVIEIVDRNEEDIGLFDRRRSSGFVQASEDDGGQEGEQVERVKSFHENIFLRDAPAEGEPFMRVQSI